MTFYLKPFIMYINQIKEAITEQIKTLLLGRLESTHSSQSSHLTDWEAIRTKGKNKWLSNDGVACRRGILANK